MTTNIEDINEINQRKRANRWDEYKAQFYGQQPALLPAPLPQKAEAKDTISAAPAADSSRSYLGQMWDVFKSPFIYGKNKISSLFTSGGTPALDKPTLQPDYKAHSRLMQEIRAMLAQMKESANMTDEDFKADEITLMKIIFECLSKQKEMLEEGGKNLKFQFVLTTNQDTQLRKEKSNLVKHLDEAEKYSKTWGRVSTGLIWGTTAITVASIAVTAIGTFGASSAALMPTFQLAMTASQGLASIATGGATMIKTRHDDKIKTFEKESKLLTKEHQVRAFTKNIYKEELVKALNHVLTCAIAKNKLARELLRAGQSVNSRAAPAA